MVGRVAASAIASARHPLQAIECAGLGFVISCCTENVHQLFVSDVIPVLVEFLVCRGSGPACSGVLDVLHDFDEGALGCDVAFRCGRERIYVAF
jgi:hypothetical protein